MVYRRLPSRTVIILLPLPRSNSVFVIAYKYHSLTSMSSTSENALDSVSFPTDTARSRVIIVVMVGTRLILRHLKGINMIRSYLWLHGTKQGVSGSGKTTLARVLAETLTLPFIDGDDLHSQTNKEKMARSEPLTDADRMPWLESVRRAAVEAVESDSGGEIPGVVVACSALKASYRDVLRGKHADIGAQQEGAPCGLAVTADGKKGDTRQQWVEERRVVEQAGDGNMTLARQAPPRTYFVHPFGPRSILQERLTARKSHFMKANMLASQLDTLENPAEIGEEGVVEIRLDASPEEQVRAAMVGLRTVGAIPTC